MRYSNLLPACRDFVSSSNIFICNALPTILENQKESLIDSKTISAPAMVGNSKIYCYCGSVMAISGIEVVVTSENTNLHLGSISGTSVSGRIRRLSASFNSDGTLHIDHLQNARDLEIKSAA